jgi:hypothetical protein
LGFAEHQGVIDDPDGYTNMRAEKRLDAAVLARVKSGELFSFECEPGDVWCRVTRSSGQSGWIHSSRVRLHFTGRALRGKTTSNHELHYITRKLGIDYYALARRAATGDPIALRKVLRHLDTDGAAAELHFSALPAVFHLAGDDKFAEFLKRQPLPYQLNVRASLASSQLATYPFDSGEYLRRHFPKTSELLFRTEIVDWLSPDGRFAIRKRFADPDDLEKSSVARAELIERATGNVLLEMTGDDIGRGAEREGKIVWSPDSNRFASLSCNLVPPGSSLFSKPPPEPQRKKTTIYQKSGESFSRVQVKWDELPGRTTDDEAKAAVVGHEFIEPIRWLKPNILLLERHEYFEKLVPASVGERVFNTVHSFDRLYQITVTIRADNTATAVSELSKRRD